MIGSRDPPLDAARAPDVRGGPADAEAGEVPKAYVVRNGQITAEEVMAHVAERVAPHKKIRAAEFVDQRPKSATGKLLRRVLLERERVRST